MPRHRPLRVFYADLYLYFSVVLHHGERSRIEWSMENLPGRWVTCVETNCGMHLYRPPLHRECIYQRAPRNSVLFAQTGWEGIHYSFLVLDGSWSELSPVVLTDPRLCRWGRPNNVIVGENLTEFLCLGIRTGYEALYEMVCDADGDFQDESAVAELEAIEFPERMDPELKAALQGLAERFGLKPLANVAERLRALQHRYQPLIQPPLPRPPLGTEAMYVRERARERLRPGDAVIWHKRFGGLSWPVKATVAAIHAKRVTIAAEDPDDTGAGIVTRSVDPTSLWPQEHGPANSPQPRRRRRLPPTDSLSDQIP